MDSRMEEANDKRVGESMLLELSIAAHNALVDEVGMGKAMSAMRPYIANAARFTVHGAIPSHFGGEKTKDENIELKELIQE